MRKFVFFLLLISIPLILCGQEILEKIEIEGNERVTRETILYYMSLQEGDPYNENLIKQDFGVLWSTGFFSNIEFKKSQGERGRVIKIVVEENPVIKEIVYKTGKKIKEDDIVDKLKEENINPLPYSYYNPYRIQQIEATIKSLLTEKGLASAVIKTDINKKGQNEVEVIFDIDEGPKIRVGQIIFDGRPRLEESTLLNAIKEHKAHGLISWVSGKDRFKPNKLSEDLESLKERFHENGFMEAVIGEPRIEDITKRTIFLKKQTMKRIVIPVHAGYRYRVSEVTIQGSKVFAERFLRSLLQNKKDEVYSTKKRKKSMEEIGDAYRNFGYLYAQVVPVENLDPKRKRVSLTYNIYEGDVAFLNRLEFKGNTYTRDKVIRREMLLREGDRFSLALFKDSVLRLKQLGLVELQGEPEIKPNPQDPTQIDVNLGLTELQRNNIQFTGGYSGYYGAFIALTYGTVNFLGAGEKLDLTFQYGKRMKIYSFGFTEPYIFDLPMSVGFNIYDRYMVYPYLYNQKSQGVDLNFGGRIKGYLRGSIVYSYQYVTLTEAEAGDSTYNPYSSYGYGGGYGGYGGGYGGGYSPYYSMGRFGMGNYHISSISPSVYRNTVDSPLTPSRGTLYLASCKFAGGPLGGDIDLIKPRFEWSYYQPVVLNHSLGFHLEYSFNIRQGDQNIPFWERFYLGGEMSIRGYDIYTIGPRSPEGRNQGGEKSLVFNAEYIIPVGGPLYTIFFFDAGNAYALDQDPSLNNIFTSAGVELRVFIPAIRIPFRLIFAYNNRRIYMDDSNFNFRFAVGTTF